MKSQLSSLAVAAAMLACAPLSFAADAQPSLVVGQPLISQGWVPTQTRALLAPALRVANDMGHMAEQDSVHITVALKLRNKDALDTLTGQLASNRPPAVLTKEEFLDRHAPTRAQAVAVVNYLRSLGFQQVSMSDNRLLVSAEGSPAQIKRAFNAEMHHFSVAGRSKLAYANVTDAQVPPHLADSVLAVTGLQTVHTMHTTIQRPAAAASPLAVGHINPASFATIYGAAGLPSASSATIGIITAGGMSHTVTDLKAFAAKNGYPEPPVSVITIGDPSNDISAIAEWNMDTQVSLAAAGGTIHSMLLYTATDLQSESLLAAYNQAMTDNRAKVINVSLGLCEVFAVSDGTQAAADQVFQAAMAQGQTFSVSSGDAGSAECEQSGDFHGESYPAVSPYVMAIGGTTLSTSGGNWAGETAWSGSGGGISTFEAAPAWQKAAGVLRAGSNQRGIPDVSFDADPKSGAVVQITGFDEVFGGTSLAAPLFTGFYSRIQAAHGNTLSFPAPTLYAGAAANPSWFHDVTVGSNGGFTAGVGWDYVTGFGSLQIQNYASSLSGAPTVTADFNCVASFLVVQCTDRSTDKNGSIGSRFWSFGDGSTSTATNPTHTYAAAGTYTIFETVTEATTGKQSKQNQTVVVAPRPVPSPQLLLNTGFEGGAVSWVASPGVVCSLVACAGEAAHVGGAFAWLDGYGTAGTNTLAQTVSIPSGKASATLAFYLHIDTAETTRTAANDTLKVQVSDASGNVVATLATYSNLNAATGYSLKSLDMKAFIGRTVKISFVGTENASLQTSFVLDDITLTAQ